MSAQLSPFIAFGKDFTAKTSQTFRDYYIRIGGDSREAYMGLSLPSNPPRYFK